MDFYYLNFGECFNTNKDLLYVDVNSEIYYIKSKDKKYIAWGRNDSTYTKHIGKRDCIVNIVSYYSVLDESKVLSMCEIYDLNTGKLLVKNNNVIVEKLSNLLELKLNQKRVFKKRDIERIVSNINSYQKRK